MHHLAVVTLTCLLSVVIAVPYQPSSSRLQRLQGFRDLVNGAPTPPVKPKRYRCVLIEDDDAPEEHPAAKYMDKFVVDTNIDYGKTVTLVGTPKTATTTTPAPTTRAVFVHNHHHPIVTEDDDEAYYTTTARPATLVPVVHIPPFRRVNQPVRQLPAPAPIPNSVAPNVQVRQPLRSVQLPATPNVPPPSAFPANVAPPKPPPPFIANAPLDRRGRPLILSPQHCDTLKHYADMFSVPDAREWVHNNCGFAQTYLPDATCEEIDILVASCYIPRPNGRL